jgi:hypothetical protein
MIARPEIRDTRCQLLPLLVVGAARGTYQISRDSTEHLIPYTKRMDQILWF